VISAPRRPKWTRDGWINRLRHAVGWCPWPHFEARESGGVLRLGLLKAEKKYCVISDWTVIA
jgi:hypothetical protein